MPGLSKVIDTHSLNKLIHAYHVLGNTENAEKLKKKYFPETVKGYDKNLSMKKTAELNYIYRNAFFDEIKKYK